MTKRSMACRALEPRSFLLDLAPVLLSMSMEVDTSATNDDQTMKIR